MPDDIQQLKNRMTELANRAFSKQCYVFSEFLTLAEQDVLLSIASNAGAVDAKKTIDALAAPLKLLGGYDGAERKLARFGDPELLYYEEDPPLGLISVEPLSLKFADALTHRDFLGALMSLGLRRSVLGDIILKDGGAYIVCLDSVSDFIVREFIQVKHTAVSCAHVDTLPEIITARPEISRINVASERLDAVVAAVYKLSRGDSQALFAQGKVYLNGRATENTSLRPDMGDIVSVRGSGRFIYEGIERETRKGRLFVAVRIY